MKSYFFAIFLCTLMLNASAQSLGWAFCTPVTLAVGTGSSAFMRVFCREKINPIGGGNAVNYFQLSLPNAESLFVFEIVKQAKVTKQKMRIVYSSNVFNSGCAKINDCRLIVNAALV
eukprot:IDg4686t1